MSATGEHGGLLPVPCAKANAGAAWIFTRTGSEWSGATELVPTGQTGTAATEFGFGVALSAAGDTALVTGREDNNGVGSAWVFVRTGESWAQQGPKLSPCGGTASLSDNGNTAVVACHLAGVNIYERSGGTWRLNGNYGPLSTQVEAAVSGDGDTVIIAYGGKGLVVLPTDLLNTADGCSAAGG